MFQQNKFMNINILNKRGEKVNMELVFSFICQDNGKTYVALNNKEDIFEPGSRYANIDIFEVIQTKGRYIYVSDISDADWNIVKKVLQFNVFSKMN